MERCIVRPARMRELTILCVLIFAASPALADPETTLLLRDGTRFEGHVLRMERGRRVVLRLDEDGTVRIVPWEQIEDITGVAAFMLPQVDEWEPPARPLPQPGWVPLTIESDGDPLDVGPHGMGLPPGKLSPGERAQRVWRMCVTPCTYYVRPGPVRVQTAFSEEGLKLDVPPAGLDVKIHPASTGLAVFGGTLLLLGPPIMLASAIYMPRPGDLKNGAAALGIGTAMTAVGIVGTLLARPRAVSRRQHIPLLSFGVAPERGGAAALTQGRF
jgi:hypothetical protein